MNKKINIHSFLEKPKYRALFLFTPSIFVIIFAIILLIIHDSNIDVGIINLTKFAYLISTLFLILSSFFVLYSDYKRNYK